MKFNFTYKSIKYVIAKGEFIKQINAKYNKQYVLKNVNMEDYVANIFVADNNIKDIEYVGDDLVYYKITYKNNCKTNMSKNEIIGNTDFLQARLIDNNLVVLEMPHYSYLSFITGYGTYVEDNNLIINFPEDKALLINKLQRIMKQEILDVKDLSNLQLNERVYNGDITYSYGAYKYKTTDKLIHKTRDYKFAYIPDKKIVIIIK